MQYLAELVQYRLGISVLPPMSVRAVTAAGRPPTGPAQALLAYGAGGCFPGTSGSHP